MASEWFYLHDGVEYGPVSTSQVKGLAASGQLLPSDFVWLKGMSDPIAASRLKLKFAPLKSAMAHQPEDSATLAHSKPPARQLWRMLAAATASLLLITLAWHLFTKRNHALHGPTGRQGAIGPLEHGLTPDAKALSDAARDDARLIVAPGDAATAYLEIATFEIADKSRASQTLRNAEASITCIADPLERRNAWIEIGEIETRLGNVGAARKALAQAEVAAAEVSWHRTYGYALIAVGLAKAGDFEGAKAVAQSINNDEDARYALLGIISAMSRAGKVDEAKAMAAQLSPALVSAQGYVEIAINQAKSGNVATAESTLSGIQDIAVRSRGLIELAEVQIKAGDLDGARQSVDTASAIRPVRALPPSEKLKIAITRAGIGDNAEAMREIDSLITEADAMPMEDDRASSYLSIANALIEMGNYSAAGEVAGKAANFPNQDLAAQLAATMAKAGSISKAKSIADLIQNPEGRAEANSTIAIEQVRRGDIAGAHWALSSALEAAKSETTLAKTEGYVYMVRALTQVAAAEVEIGNISDAIESVRELVNDPRRRIDIYSQLADRLQAAAAASSERTARIVIRSGTGSRLKAGSSASSSVGRTAAKGIGAHDHVDTSDERLEFLKKVCPEVLDREDLDSWIHRQRNARRVSVDRRGQFSEYAAGDNLATSHAVFLDHRMAMLEWQVWRGDREHANKAMEDYIEKLGPPETDVLPDGLSANQQHETVVFHQWRIEGAARTYIVRCSIRRSNAPQDVPAMFFFNQTVADLEAINAAAESSEK